MIPSALRLADGARATGVNPSGGFTPAIARAEHGFALSRVGNGFFKATNGRVRGDAREVFFDSSDAPGIGAIIKQPRLAETYRSG